MNMDNQCAKTQKKWHEATSLQAEGSHDVTLNRPCQGQCPGLALLLLVLGILADHHDLALAADDLALLADGLHGRTNLHALLPPVVESERGQRPKLPLPD